MEDLKILLNKSISKNSTNINNTINIGLSNNSRLLPSDSLLHSVNLGEQYNKERKECNKIRLTCIVNPICSNVLFNYITEVVKDEGSENVQVLNYDKTGEKKFDFTNVYGKTKEKTFWTNYSAIESIRDTQLSNDANGFEYHCGFNIFNNHLLRSKTFKTVCKFSGSTTSDDFNTIKDLMRKADGTQIKGYNDIDVAEEEPNIDLHLYLNDEIMSFKDTASEYLIEENGWFGFHNRGKMVTYEDDKILDINKPINNRKACDFVDMYPDRTLYSFNPKYNKFKNRLEKNWNYCITYPSSSTTENISFINKTISSDNNKPLNSLKAIYFDENVKNYNGTDSTVIYSISKHGLAVGDSVNIYKTYDGDNHLIFRDVEVVSVVDEYIFTIFSNGIVMSNQWIGIRSEEEENELEGKGEDKDIYVTNDGRTLKINTNKTCLSGVTKDDNTYFIVNNRVNVDVTAQNISFKKVVDGIECDYYVRIFSKLPNWRFVKRKISEYEIYKKDSKLIEENQIDFENMVGKAGFSKNIYSDDVSQIVYTDDIDISYLKDNLSRPLTDIFLTIVKNNRGYKDWYGINGYEIIIKEENVKIPTNIEYSHCFGKVNCAFKLSDESLVDDWENPNITSINNVNGKDGITLDNIRGENIDTRTEDDEIDYYNDVNYIGDLCCYCETDCSETSIQMVQHRFNTAQRELRNATSEEYFDKLIYDELVSDDYDYDGFKVNVNEFNGVCRRKEGYYYEPHYKIPIKSFSQEVQMQYPKFFTMNYFNKLNENEFEIITLENNYLEINDKFVFYDKLENKPYYGTVTNVLGYKKFVCELVDENDKTFNITPNRRRFRILKPDITIPNYARLSKDGTCRYFWREILQNGFDNQSDNEIYPFTNGALYVNLPITLYVKRQDPNNMLKEYSLNGDTMRSTTYPYDPTSNIVKVENEDNYYNEIDIVC